MQEVDGRCGAKMFLGDDYGDNSCTFRCQLPAGHEGLHEEKFEHKQEEPDPERPNWVPPRSCGKATLTWENDERFPCPTHGVQPGTSCRTCDEERREFLDARTCSECWGLGKDMDESPCPRCQNTGFDPEKCPEGHAQALVDGLSPYDIADKKWA
jgi:hypothetical protein